MNFLLILTLLVTACAGPTTPFGAMENTFQFQEQPTALMDGHEDNSTQSASTATFSNIVIFEPEYQVLHRDSNLMITLHSSVPITPQAKFVIFYNGQDITQIAMRHGRLHNSTSHQWTYEFDHLSLPADRQHNIRVAFQAQENQPLTYATFRPPVCELSVPQKVKSTGDFEVPDSYLSLIDLHARRNGYNPVLIAALIAQESSFQSDAVSWAKAVGLTQVTSLAEFEVIDDYPQWPRYPSLREFSVPAIRLMIMTGKVHEKNEWRLDPDRSILGGISYLNYLRDYWEKPENWQRIKRAGSDTRRVYTKVLLASYNSGPARVKMTINQLARDWLEHDKLNAAREYVNKIMSFCQEFSKERNMS